jgi:hypothetical protein
LAFSLSVLSVPLILFPWAFLMPQFTLLWMVFYNPGLGASGHQRCRLQQLSGAGGDRVVLINCKHSCLSYSYKPLHVRGALVVGPPWTPRSWMPKMLILKWHSSWKWVTFAQPPVTSNRL